MKRLLSFLVVGIVISGCALKKNGETRSNNGKKSAYFTDAVSAETESQPIDSGSVEPKISTYEVDGEIVEYTETWAGPETSEPSEPVCAEAGLMLTTPCEGGCRPGPGAQTRYQLDKACPDTTNEVKCETANAVWTISASCEGSNCRYRKHVLESKKRCIFKMVDPIKKVGVCNNPPAPAPPPPGRLCREASPDEKTDELDCNWPLACYDLLDNPCAGWQSWPRDIDRHRKCSDLDIGLYVCQQAIQEKPECASYKGVTRQDVLNRLFRTRRVCQECKEGTRN